MPKRGAPRRRSTGDRLSFAVVALAAVLRIGWLATNADYAYDAGLTAPQAVMAHELQRGNGFVVDVALLEQVAERQSTQGRLVGLDEVGDVPEGPKRTNPLVLPGLSIVMAALWVLAPGEPYWAMQLVQIALDLVNVWLVLDIGRRLFGRTAGTAAGALYAVTPAAIAFAVTPLEPVWLMLAVLVAIRTWVRLDERGGENRWPALAVVVAAVGAAAYVRSTVLLVPIALGLASALRTRWREAIAFASLGTVAAYALFAPWVLRQRDAVDAWLPLGRTGTGQTLWEGLGRLPNEHGAVRDDEATYRQVVAAGYDYDYGSPQYDRVLLSWYRDVLEDDPGFVARTIGDRALETWRLPSAPLRPIQRWWSVALTAAGLAGAVVARRRAARWAVLLSCAAVVWLAQLPFLTEPRFHQPFLTPLYVVLAGAAVAWAVERTKLTASEPAIAVPGTGASGQRSPRPGPSLDSPG